MTRTFKCPNCGASLPTPAIAGGDLSQALGLLFKAAVDLVGFVEFLILHGRVRHDGQEAILINCLFFEQYVTQVGKRLALRLENSPGEFHLSAQN